MDTNRNTFLILTLNPGSTSTKIGVFENEAPRFTRTVSHSAAELEQYGSIMEELPLRQRTVEELLDQEGFELSRFHAVVGRGGLLRSIPCGTYPVSEEMIADLEHASREGGHASNLAGIMARGIGEKFGIPSFIVDPVIVDELMDEARITGYPGIVRKSIWHALNQKATAKRAARELARSYDELNLIVAHLGGGVSVGAHRMGRVVDVNDAFNGDGPFSPQRSGALPVADVVELALSGTLSREELLKIPRGRGGLAAYFGTQDAREVCEMVDAGSRRADLVYRAMAYRIGCAICAAAAALEGNVDGIILTGGLAYEERLVGLIRQRVAFLGRVLLYPGEDELQALAEGALRVLRGEEEPGDYSSAAVQQEKRVSLLLEGIGGSR